MTLKELMKQKPKEEPKLWLDLYGDMSRITSSLNGIKLMEKDNNEFEASVKEVKSRTIYDYGIEVSGKDKVLTLSSCIGGGKKRVVLHAKLIEE